MSDNGELVCHGNRCNLSLALITPSLSSCARMTAYSPAATSSKEYMPNNDDIRFIFKRLSFFLFHRGFFYSVQYFSQGNG